MLDTNTCIHLIKNKPLQVARKLSDVPVGGIVISSIVLAELWFGVAASRDKKKNEAALDDFFQYAIVHDWPQEAGPIYGSIREHLRENGTPIGANDLLIAAHALALKLPLVTDNVREFQRIPHLKLENWIR